MARRAHGDEGVRDDLLHDLVDRQAGAADSAHRGLHRARTHGGVAVELHQTFSRRGAFERADIGLRVGAQNRFAVADRRLFSQQGLEALVFQNALDRPDAIRPFGMVGPHVMRERRAMRYKQRAQWTYFTPERGDPRLRGLSRLPSLT